MAGVRHNKTVYLIFNLSSFDLPLAAKRMFKKQRKLELKRLICRLCTANATNWFHVVQHVKLPFNIVVKCQTLAKKYTKQQQKTRTVI